LSGVGLSVDVVKRELQHYSRKSKIPALTIRFTDDDGVIRTVAPGDTVKWLGVHLDRKLHFNHHVKRVAAKATRAVSGLQMLANTVRELSHNHLRHLYKACVTPVMTYASPVWWTGKR
ncbi:hypothetical protein C8J56DRAFT_711329, partial [Mycena floridula]